jgi:hypothetical protein
MISVLLLLAAQTAFELETYPAQPGEHSGNRWALRLAALQNDAACAQTTSRGGCTVNLRCNTTYVTEVPWVLCRGMKIQGCGGYQGSTIQATTATITEVIRVEYFNRCNATILSGGYGFTGGSGAFSELNNLNIKCISRSDHVGAPQHGVYALAQVRLNHNQISSCTNGVRFYGSALATPWPSNSNISWSQANRYISNAHAGVHIDGPDANAITFIGDDISSNCVNATPALNAEHALSVDTDVCANVVDSSFLGNTYTSIHTASPFTTSVAGETISTTGGAVTRRRLQRGQLTRTMHLYHSAPGAFKPGYFVTTSGLQTGCNIANRFIQTVTSTYVAINLVDPTDVACATGAMSDGTGTITANSRYYPGWWLDPYNNSSRNTVLGSYSEGDEFDHLGSNNSIVIGGFTGAQEWQRGPSGAVPVVIGDAGANKLRFFNPTSRVNVASLGLGESCGVGGCFMDFTTSLSDNTTGQILRWKNDPANKAVEVKVAELTSAIPFRMTVNTDSVGGVGKLHLPTDARAGGLTVPGTVPFGSVNQELFANGASTTLAAAGMNSIQSTIPLAPGTGNRFPVVTSPRFMRLSISNGAAVEYVTCSTHSLNADTISGCTRGQEGSVASSWVAGSAVQQRITAATLDNLKPVKP